MSKTSNKAGTSDGAPSALEVYEVAGDSATALKLLNSGANSKATPADAYNRQLLTAIVEGSVENVKQMQSLMEGLNETGSSVLDAHASPTAKKSISSSTNTAAKDG